MNRHKKSTVNVTVAGNSKKINMKTCDKLLAAVVQHTKSDPVVIDEIIEITPTQKDHRDIIMLVKENGKLILYYTVGAVDTPDSLNAIAFIKEYSLNSLIKS